MAQSVAKEPKELGLEDAVKAGDSTHGGDYRRSAMRVARNLASLFMSCLLRAGGYLDAARGHRDTTNRALARDELEILDVDQHRVPECVQEVKRQSRYPVEEAASQHVSVEEVREWPD